MQELKKASSLRRFQIKLDLLIFNNRSFYGMTFDSGSFNFDSTLFQKKKISLFKIQKCIHIH